MDGEVSGDMTMKVIERDPVIPEDDTGKMEHAQPSDFVRDPKTGVRPIDTKCEEAQERRERLMDEEDKDWKKMYGNLREALKRERSKTKGLRARMREYGDNDDSEVTHESLGLVPPEPLDPDEPLTVSRLQELQNSPHARLQRRLNELVDPDEVEEMDRVSEECKRAAKGLTEAQMADVAAGGIETPEEMAEALVATAKYYQKTGEFNPKKAVERYLGMYDEKESNMPKQVRGPRTMSSRNTGSDIPHSGSKSYAKMSLDEKRKAKLAARRAGRPEPEMDFD